MDIGLIFDWDGVVIHSADAHKRSWEELARERELDLPVNHFEKTFGKRNLDIIPNILKWSQVPSEIFELYERKEILYRKKIAQGEASLIQGVVNFLKEAKAAGVPCAVGSSTSRENIKAGMHFGDLTHYFDAVSCADDVKRGKPAPDVFLNAADKIQCNPQRCVVFEDSPFGIEAAKAAGMIAVGVSSETHQGDSLREADLVVSSFLSLGLKQIHELI